VFSFNVSSSIDLSSISADTVSTILDDLSLGATRLADMLVHPFVALDYENRQLSVLPHFVLLSNSEDNILRTCSMIRPRFYNATSAEKENEMREGLCSLTSPFKLNGPIKLPRGDLPDIDLLVEDIGTGTVAICELKWGRKPYLASEFVSRNAELVKGWDQLRMIQEFVQGNPQFLRDRGFLSRSLGDYTRVNYLLVARDHLMWIPPSWGRAIVAFNPFKAMLQKADLSAGLGQLLSYEWLPVEGKDFKVVVESMTLNGVTLRDEVFSRI